MKNYRNFNFSLLVVIPLVAGLYLMSIYFLYSDQKNDSLSIQTYLNYKDNLVNEIKGNKILFSSGSNNFLGIRAYQVADEYNIPAVNLSVHASLGTSYIIERVKRIVKKGDVVILPLEYGNLTYNGDQSIVLNKYLLSYDRAYFNSNFNINKKLSMLSSISVLDLFSLLFFPLSDEEKSQIENNYLKNINDHGDMLNMTEHDSLKTKKNPFKLPKPISLETFALKEIIEFNEYCNNHGISLYLTYPNIVYDTAYRTDKYVDYFDFLNRYFSNHQVSVIGLPEDGMYPRELFFDSEYHLISKGSDLRTADFIKLMNQDNELLKRINEIRKN